MKNDALSMIGGEMQNIVVPAAKQNPQIGSLAINNGLLSLMKESGWEQLVPDPPPPPSLLLNFEGAENNGYVIDDNGNQWLKTSSSRTFQFGDTGTKYADFLASSGRYHLSLPVGTKKITPIFTVSAKILVRSYPTANGGYRTIFSLDNPFPSTQRPFYFMIYRENGVTRLYCLIRYTDSTYTFVRAPDAFPLNSLVDVAVASDGTTLRMFINGNVVASAAMSAGKAILAHGSTPYKIGGNDSTEGTNLDGQCHKLMFYHDICMYTQNYTPTP
jgi:hypothetical protein